MGLQTSTAVQEGITGTVRDRVVNHRNVVGLALQFSGKCTDGFVVGTILAKICTF